MCHRISPLLIEELRAALEERRASGHARVPRREPDEVVPDVYPGRQLPLFVPNDAGELTVLTGTGDVTGSLLSAKVFITHSDTGMVDVPETTTGGKCKITTDTGDISMDVLNKVSYGE